MIWHLQNQISVWDSSTGEEQRESRACKVQEPCKTRRSAPYTLDTTVLSGNKILDFCSLFFASASSSSQPPQVVPGLHLLPTHVSLVISFKPHSSEYHQFAKGLHCYLQSVSLSWFPLGCLLRPSNSVCPKLSSWSIPLSNVLHPVFPF